MMAKSVDNIPTWFLLASLATSIGVLYYIGKYEELRCVSRLSFPYTVDGLKHRGHPIPPTVQDCADRIEAENKANFGDWDNPYLTHWVVGPSASRGGLPRIGNV